MIAVDRGALIRIALIRIAALLRCFTWCNNAVIAVDRGALIRIALIRIAALLRCFSWCNNAVIAVDRGALAALLHQQLSPRYCTSRRLEKTEIGPAHRAQARRTTAPPPAGKCWSILPAAFRPRYGGVTAALWRRYGGIMPAFWRRSHLLWLIAACCILGDRGGSGV